jgi:hypothetical protein
VYVFALNEGVFSHVIVTIVVCDMGQTFDDNGIAKALPSLEARTTFTDLSTSPTNIMSPICRSAIESLSPITTSTIKHPMSTISKGVVAAKQQLAGKANPTVVKICGKAKAAIVSLLIWR